MTTPPSPPQCTRCGGTDLRSGHLHAYYQVGFIPIKRPFFSLTSTIPLSATACLTCGHIDMTLLPEYLPKLRASSR